MLKNNTVIQYNPIKKDLMGEDEHLNCRETALYLINVRLLRSKFNNYSNKINIL